MEIIVRYDDDCNQPPCFLQGMDFGIREELFNMHKQFVQKEKERKFDAFPFDEDWDDHGKERAAKSKARSKRRRTYRDVTTPLNEPLVLRMSLYEKHIRAIQYFYNNHDAENLAEIVLFPGFNADVFRSINIFGSRPSHDKSPPLIIANYSSAKYKPSNALMDVDITGIDVSVAFSGVGRLKAGFARVFSLVPDCFIMCHSPCAEPQPDGKVLLTYNIGFFCTLALMLPSDPSDEKSPLTLQPVRVELHGFNQSLFDENNKVLTSLDRHGRIVIDSPAVNAAQVMLALGY